MKPDEQRFLCRLIAEYMRVHALDQKGMAERLSVSPASLSEWLNPAKHGISRKYAERILFICRDCYSAVRSPVNEKNPAAIEKFRYAVIAAVMISDELPPESKDVFYKILRTVEVSQ